MVLGSLTCSFKQTNREISLVSDHLLYDLPELITLIGEPEFVMQLFFYIQIGHINNYLNAHILKTHEAPFKQQLMTVSICQRLNIFSAYLFILHIQCHSYIEVIKYPSALYSDTIRHESFTNCLLACLQV